MTRALVETRQLGKRYTLGEGIESDLLRDRITQGFKRLLRRDTAEQRAREEFWALRNISFEVQEGEVLGIIGRNGAGKSTLLKILSRITDPTEGEVRLRGRVASLLEVGTGFHKELTGRENVYLNGAILGMSRVEIKRKFDEIVEFAGVQRFINTPVKRYSSGMTVRLAFAVAAHLDPEILIIDEVLAVGDAEFQSRCLGKLGEVSRSGRTILFVSHDLVAVEKLCSTAIYLERGQVASRGPANQVIRDYLAATATDAIGFNPVLDLAKDAQVLAARLLDPSGAPLAAVTTNSAVVLEIEVLVRRSRRDLKLAVCLNDELRRPLFSSNPGDSGIAHPAEVGTHIYRLFLPPALLMSRVYHLTFALYTASAQVDHLPDVMRFEVEREPSRLLSIDGKRVGLLQIECHWQTSAPEKYPAAFAGPAIAGGQP